MKHDNFRAQVSKCLRVLGTYALMHSCTPCPAQTNLNSIMLRGWIIVTNSTPPASTNTALLGNPTIDWAHWGIGVPSSVNTNRTVVDATLTSSANAGSINAAIQACASNHVVFLSAGNYTLSSNITPDKNYVTLRGAGLSNTFVNFTGSGHIAADHGNGRPSATITIMSGATNGSSSVVVNSGTLVAANELIRIEQQNPPWVMSKDVGTNVNLMSYVFFCTNVVGNTVYFTPALPFTMTNSPVLASYSGTSPVVIGVGIEDMTINLTNSTADYGAVWFVHHYGCWVHNVEAEGQENGGRGLILEWGCNDEVSGCYLHDTRAYGSNAEGLDLFQDVCFTLIQNNVVSKYGYSEITLNDGTSGGCSGNIIGYNYVDKMYTGQGAYSFDVEIHGPHCMFNLFEGNIGAGIAVADGIHGSSSHNTVYRNWWRTCCEDTNNGTSYTGYFAVSQAGFSWWNNIVGNILGSTGFPLSGQGGYQASGQSFAPLATKANWIWWADYPQTGNSTFTYTNPPTSDYADFAANAIYDTFVETNMFRHMNYDYATHSITNNAPGYTTTLSNSLYLASKPAWFGALPWPPFDPNNPGAANVTNIPAGYRYVYGVNP